MRRALWPSCACSAGAVVPRALLRFYAVLHTGSNEPTRSSKHFLQFWCRRCRSPLRVSVWGGCHDRDFIRVKPCGGSACRCGRCGAALALNYCAARGDHDRLRAALRKCINVDTFCGCPCGALCGSVRAFTCRGHNFTPYALRRAVGLPALVCGLFAGK